MVGVELKMTEKDHICSHDTMIAPVYMLKQVIGSHLRFTLWFVLG